MVIPIVRPRLPTLDSISDKFGRALYQGVVTNNGEHVQRFERKLEQYLRIPTLAFNNGQTALLTMLMAAGIGPGDEVIVPSFTFAGTIAAIRTIGAVPIFAEVHPTRLTIDSEDVAQRVKLNTKAILGVDVYGICCDYKALEIIADDCGKLCLFDSAPAFGSMIGAFPTGHYGDAQIFSFHVSKVMNCMEGGALCTGNEKIFERAKHIRDFGQTEDRECVEVGLNGKMMEVCALIGIENLKDWSEYRHGRMLKSAVFRHRLFGIEGLRLTPEPAEQWPIWLYMPVFIEPSFGRSRDEVLAGLHARNIMARKYYTACHLLKPFANGQRLPITEMLADQVVALPMFTDYRDDEMNRIADAFREMKDSKCAS